MISVMDWIEVEDFGPVRHAKIELKSLTVLTGQHNTGKTYLATLFYLLMKFLRDVRDAVNPALSYGGTCTQSEARTMIRRGKY